jgi:NhaA family Na+:H+ antiporter
MPIKKAMRVLIDPIQQFLKLEALGGLLLMSSAVFAMVLANSGIGVEYERFWQTSIGFHLGAFQYAMPLHFFINHGLMTLFFLFIGLQIKKEILIGVLASRKRATLPLFAAVGGILLPALIYLLINPPGSYAAKGWGIPIATDIAFVMGVLMLLGNRIPIALKIFLMALAVADDMGGILVITLFYSTALAWLNLGIALGLWACLLLLSRMDYRQITPYLLIGLLLWMALLHSGIPPTIAGVLLAAAIPAKPLINPKDFGREARGILDEFKALKESHVDILHHDAYQAGIRTLSQHCRNALTPLQQLENTLHPWVNFLILPLFALANAGVSIQRGHLLEAYQSPITWGIMAGLCLGKPLGISISAWLATRFKLAALPKGITMPQVVAASFLGGISFTMALFISYLSFAGSAGLLQAKFGIFTASIISVCLGCLFLKFTLNAARNTRGA